MKHNGVVTRILKTSSATSAGTAGGASKARPATPAATPGPLASDGAAARASALSAPSAQAKQAVDDEVDDLFAGMGDDLAKEAEQTPVFAANMEREIAAILARGGVKTRTPTASALTPQEAVPAPQIKMAPATDSPPRVQMAVEAEGDRVTVRAPGHDPDSEPGGAAVAPPRPPPLPSDLHNAVTARPPRNPPPLPPERPPSPQASPMPQPVQRQVVPAAKPPAEPVRVHVKPPPVPLAMGPRRPEPVVEVIDAPAETRREPGGRATAGLARRTTNARVKPPPPVEYWADTSLVESVPPSDPAESPVRLLGDGREYAQSYPRGFQGQGLVLYHAAREGEILPDRQALHGPPPLPAAAFTAARLTPIENTPVQAPSPATAWVQQPALNTAAAKRPLRARLQAAALGIAAGVAISMVLTWRPEKAAPEAPTGALAGAQANAVAMMTPPRAPERAAPAASSAAPAESVAPKPAVPASDAAQAPSTRAPEKRESAPQSAPPAKAAPPKPGPSKPAATQASKPAATQAEPAQTKTPKLSGRVAGDDE